MQGVAGHVGGGKGGEQDHNDVGLPALKAVDGTELEARVEAPEGVLGGAVFVGILDAEAARVDAGILEQRVEL